MTSIPPLPCFTGKRFLNDREELIIDRDISGCHRRCPGGEAPCAAERDIVHEPSSHRNFIETPEITSESLPESNTSQDSIIWVLVSGVVVKCNITPKEYRESQL